MNRLITLTQCDDGSCCCLPPRSTVALISIMSLVASVMDSLSAEACAASCLLKDYVDSMRHVLVTMFQIANLLLLFASVVENAVLVNIYVCYTLGFVVMALCVSLLELMYRILHEGITGIVLFVPEVVFIFVISRCLPLVNMYKNHLNRIAATLSEHLHNNETLISDIIID